MADRPPIDQQVTFLLAPDLAASYAFYEQVLGLPRVLEQDCCRIYRVAGTAFVGVCDAKHLGNFEPPGKRVIFTIVTDEVDAWHDRLVAHGADVEKPPQQNDRFNIYHFFARDPAGYLLEFQRFCDPAWPRVARAGEER